MPLPHGPLEIRIAHANLHAQLKPYPRIHLTLNFADYGALPFVARGVDAWLEPDGRLALVGIGARLPDRLDAAIRAEITERMVRIGSAVSTMLLDDFDIPLRSHGLPYHALGMHGSPAPLGPLGGVALAFRSPGNGDGSFALDHGGAFALRPRPEPLPDGGLRPGGTPHPASVDAHVRWGERWGGSAMASLETAMGPTARRLLGNFRALLLRELPTRILIPEERR